MAFKLSPELSDGFNPTVVKTKEQVMEIVGMWCDEAHHYPGEPCHMEYIEMSDLEIEALPDL